MICEGCAKKKIPREKVRLIFALSSRLTLGFKNILALLAFFFPLGLENKTHNLHNGDKNISA